MPPTENDEYPGVSSLNFFTEDRLLGAVLESRLPPSDRARLRREFESFGRLCAGTIGPLIERSHLEEKLPKLIKAAGGPTVRYCPEQIKARRLAMKAGILPPIPLLERMAKAYLLNQNGEGGITCPLAMTDGLIDLLHRHGSDDQRKRYLPIVENANGPTPLTGGQMVTEKNTGSNVSENDTEAVQRPDGSWRLTGLKWFCSNPGELWVTSAKPKGSGMVALFLMPRRLANGKLNTCRIQKIKAISGTRGKATVEMQYKGAYAELIGRASHGMAILLNTVLRTSRIHTAVASLGFMRRALVEAERYAAWRVVLGKPIADFAHVQATLEGMRVRWASCLLAFFEEISLLEKDDAAADVLVPLLKIQISKAGVQQVREAQLIFAGNGILMDYPAPLTRLANDALIQEIWEGTHAILAGHALKALRRPASRRAFLAIVEAAEKNADGRRDLLEALERLLGLKAKLVGRLDELAGNEDDKDLAALRICDDAFELLRLALLLRESQGPLDVLPAKFAEMASA